MMRGMACTGFLVCQSAGFFIIPVPEKKHIGNSLTLRVEELVTVQVIIFEDERNVCYLRGRNALSDKGLDHLWNMSYAAVGGTVRNLPRHAKDVVVKAIEEVHLAGAMIISGYR